MSLESLGVENLRCIERADLELDACCNLISGPNASGKTTLLEAAYILGRGRSFRSTRPEALIRNGSDSCLLTSAVVHEGRLPRTLGLRLARDGIEARYGGRSVVGLAELARILPVQALDPDVHQLVEGGPQERRRYLDWGVFHVEQTFVDHWKRFQRALRQRNAALRDSQPEAVVRAWDPELIESGQRVAESRARYLQSLASHVATVGERLLGGPLQVTLHQGWTADRTFGEALDACWARDRERGLTHVGPHRADLAVRFDAESARDRISRGQQKLAAAALLLGQLRCDAELGSRVAVLLVDDPAAELDTDNLQRLLTEILDLPAQLIVTALDPASTGLTSLPTGHRFHVEHGAVTRLL